ncbi:MULTISPECIES: VirK/YbjX family protein [Cupriavidus]|nr:VirK/YbjX family protein [Cupriavidus pauculus]
MQEFVPMWQGLVRVREGRGPWGTGPLRYLKYLSAMAMLSAACYPAGTRRCWTRRMRMVALSALREGAVRPWLRSVGSCTLLQRVIAKRPGLLERPYRPLGELGMTFHERASLVADHYGVMHATLPLPVCERIYLDGGLTWKFGDDGEGETGRYTLRLGDSGPNPKEGELAFYWVDSATDTCLAQLSFYLTHGYDGPAVFIGGLQGPKGEASREYIRASTKACEGVRPKDAVMEALLALAGHIGARRIVAVSRANHVGRQRNTPREIQADYETFWRESHAVDLPDGNMAIPVLQPVRDIADIPSKKRSAWRRKQAMAEGIRASVACALREESDTADTGLRAA